MKAVSGQPGIGHASHRRSLRLVGVAAALAAAALSLTSCAVGQHAATAIDKPAIAGTSGQIGTIDLENVIVQAPNVVGRDTGTKFYTAGDSAPMSLTMINTGHTNDTLTSVTSSAFSSWSIVSTASLVTTPGQGATSQVLTPNVAVSLGLENLGVGIGSSDQTLVLSGLKAAAKNLYPGTTVDVTFTFANAGSTTLHVPVGLTSTPPSGSVAPASGGEAGA